MTNVSESELAAWEGFDTSSFWGALAQVSLAGQLILQPLDKDSSDWRILYANDHAARVVNATARDVMGRLLSEVAPPYGSGFRADLRRAFLSNTAVYRMTERIVPPFTPRRGEYRVQRFGELLALSFVDRSGEFDSAQEVAAMRSLLITGMIGSPAACALLRPSLGDDGKVQHVEIIEVNELAAQIAGVSRDELLGLRGMRAPFSFSGRFLKLVSKCVASRSSISIDYELANLRSAWKWVRLQITPVDEFVLAQADDITQERREETMLKGIVEHAAEMIVFSNAKGAIEYVNPHAEIIMGYPVAEVVGTSITAHTVPEDREKVRTDFWDLANGQTQTSKRHVRVVSRDGSIKTLWGSSIGIHNVHSGFEGVVTVATDLTQQIASDEEREQLVAELSMAEQRERERLAADLHDGPVQDLTALSMRLGSALSTGRADVQQLQQAEDLVVKVIADLRNVMFHLAPPELSGGGVGRALLHRAERLFEGSNMQLSYTSSLQEIPSLAVATTLYRLGQEAIFNVHKHAHAARVEIELFNTTEPHGVALKICDDGRGADPAHYAMRVDGHFGVAMMQDRARQLGGECRVSGAPGKGTQVLIQMPL